MAGLLIGLGLIAIAAVIAVDVSGMRVPPVHAKVGPRVFPYLVSCGLAVAGAVIGMAVVARNLRVRGDAADRLGGGRDRRAGLIAAHEPAQARWASSRQPLSSSCASPSPSAAAAFCATVIVALVLALTAYLAFTRLLGLQLPPGILQGLL